jgi:integrating conjugative element protein (TIGR03765 family)
MLALARRALGPLLLVAVVTSAASAQETPSAVDLPPVTIERFLPVETGSLSVGRFEPAQRRTGVSQPFFLIGCDDTSLQWLEENRARLLVLRAFGLVVQAPSVEAYRRLESVAEGLVIRPVAGDLLAEHLGIRHYPVLVTGDGFFP